MLLTVFSHTEVCGQFKCNFETEKYFLSFARGLVEMIFWYYYNVIYIYYLHLSIE